MIIISKKEFIGSLVKSGGDKLAFADIADIDKEWVRIKERIACGESIFYVGTEGRDRLREIWIESYRDENVGLPVFGLYRHHGDHGAVPPSAVPKSGGSGCACAYIRPEKTYLCHGLDEEIRADIVPLMEARGKYGNLIGFPAVLVRNYADSLVTRRYKGSFWHVFFFDNPLEVMAPSDWQAMLDIALQRENGMCFISRVGTGYPIYSRDESIRIECRISNRSDKIASLTVRLEAAGRGWNAGGPVHIGDVHRCLNAGEEICFHYDWLPEIEREYHTIKASLFLENRFIYGTEREKSLCLVDAAECGVLVKDLDNTDDPAAVGTSGPHLVIGGEDGFFTGTHYYGSNSFYEWTWRDFRADIARADMEAMKGYGLKILRIWADPTLDEQSLRGMEACVEMCGRVGMAVIITIFTSWLRWLEINLDGRRQRMDIMDFNNDAATGLYFRNIEFQSEYVSVLAGRFKGNPGVIWDITNEFAVMDPDESQVDLSRFDERYKSLPGPYNNMELFRQWAGIMETAIRDAGAEQPVIRGTACWDTGVDNYLAGSDGDIVSWHSYLPVEVAGKAVITNDASCIGKPLLIKEFGRTRPGNADMSSHYDEVLHYFLGAGAAGACSYEWGVSWLIRELPFIQAPLKYAGAVPLAGQDKRILKNRYDYAKTWPEGSIGICPWAASFEFGMNRPCTPCQSPEIKVMEKIAFIGDGLAYVQRPKGTYLVIPREYGDFTPYEGYHRKAKLLYETIEELWKRGVVFGVWQEDMLDSLPGSAKVVIYPNEDSLKENISDHFKKLAEKRVSIYTGGDGRWKEDGAVEKIAFDPSGNAHLLARDIDGGCLYFINNLEKMPARFGLSVSGTELEMELTDMGLILERHGKFLMAENQGRLAIGGKTVADVVAACDTGKYVIKSADGEDLRNSGTIAILPERPMKLLIDGAFEKADIMGMNGHIAGTALLEHVENGSLLEVTGDMAGLRLLVRRIRA